MEIIKYAMQMEKDGENYYRSLADNCENPGMASLLNLIADEEVKHYNFFANFEDNDDYDYPETGLTLNAKNIFQKMSDNNETFESETTKIDLYKKAQEIETKSETFYKEKSEEVEDREFKELLLKFAAEERKHFRLFGHIIEFIEKPEVWVENANQNLLLEY